MRATTGSTPAPSLRHLFAGSATGTGAGSAAAGSVCVLAGSGSASPSPSGLQRALPLPGGSSGSDDRQPRADSGYPLPLRDEDLLDDARAGARHLRVHLVGRDLEQAGSPASIASADLLQPLEGLLPRHGHAHLGHDDFTSLGGGHCKDPGQLP